MDLDTSIHLVSKSDAENNAAKGAAFRVFFSSVARAEPWLKADDPAGKKAALSTQLTALREMISIDAAADGNQPSRGHQNDAWKACFVAKEPKCAKYAPTKDDKPSSTTISAEDIAAGYSSFETSILSTESTVAASCYEQIKLPPTPDACRDVAELGKPGDPVKTNADKKDAGDPVKTNADRKDAGDPVKTNADRKDADN